MTHDRQTEPEDNWECPPLPRELQEQKKDSPIPSDKTQQSLGVLADWWALYGQIYRDDPTPELLASFREILKPLLSTPAVLNEALIVAARQSPEFRPKPGRIFEIAETILARRATGNRPAYLDEPPMSQEERDRALRDFPIRGKVGA